MQVKLKELKRKVICPILHRHGWDYKEQDPRSDFFRFCIAEMMRWQSRKGRGISYDILASLVSRLGVARHIDRVKVSEVQLALKKFTNTGLYSKINDLITSVEIIVGVPKRNSIVHTIPGVCDINNQTVILSWDNNIQTLDDMKQAYETRLSAMWSFYSLNRYAVFYNLYWDEDNAEIKHIRYKPNQFYIRDSKMFFQNLGKRVDEQGIYAPPLEICKGCPRRAECQTAKTRIRNWQKSW